MRLNGLGLQWLPSQVSEDSGQLEIEETKGKQLAVDFDSMKGQLVDQLEGLDELPETDVMLRHEEHLCL